jgi:hypothetical protein
MAQWKPLPISASLVQNVDESSLQGQTAALENSYITDEGTLSRFPYLTEVIDLPSEDEVYLREYQNELVAVCGGRTYIIDPLALTARDVTSAHVNGSGRVIFSETDDRLLMAAGGKVIQYRGDKTKILSKDAPESTHVAWLDGYVVIPEKGSNRFNYSENGIYESFPALNVLSAEKKPDSINAMIVSEFSELIVGGEKSIEQFDTSFSGDVPLIPRWALGSGVLAPYTLVSVDNRIWGINQQREFVAFSTQLANIESKDIQRRFKAVTDWAGAWAEEVNPNEGQNFIILKVPNVMNPYGTQGMTFAFDYRKSRWSELYGWDEQEGRPTAWPGTSYAQVGNQHYVGGKGKIYTLGGSTGTENQRFLWRSGHLDISGSRASRVDGFRMRLKRGFSPAGARAPIVSIRVNKNNTGFGRKIRRDLGRMGEREMTLRFSGMGTAETWQFEIEVTDQGQIELVRADVLMEPLS